MSVGERDPLSGHMMTGHEWNGIKELNTPVPRVVYIFLTIFFVFALGYWLLMPAWPTGNSYTKGLLGRDERRQVTKMVESAALQRTVWTRRVANEDYPTILTDDGLMSRVREDGQRLFRDNCAACHGFDATGGPGYPNLVDRDWLWEHTPNDIAQTVSLGVNSSPPGTRVNQMLAFGRDGMLDGPTILNVSHYVLALSDASHRTRENQESIIAGRQAFDANCAICHGANGKGDQARGIPNLTDPASIYGGDLQSIFTSVDQGRQGEMPAWHERLTPLQIKILVLYLLDRNGEPR